MFLEVRTEWRRTDIEGSQRWNGKDNGDWKEQHAFTHLPVSDNGQQSDAQAAGSQEPIDE
jgi:hypothetical protein